MTKKNQQEESGNVRPGVGAREDLKDQSLAPTINVQISAHAEICTLLLLLDNSLIFYIIQNS